MNADLAAWLTVILGGLVTWAIRLSFIALPPTAHVPAWVRHCLPYVAAAVLPALVVPDVLLRDLPPGAVFNLERAMAAVLALLVAWHTRNLFATLGAGMVALWLLLWWR